MQRGIHLLNRPDGKWTKSSLPLNPGDVLLFIVQESVSGSKKDGTWRLGRVLSATDRKVKIEQVLRSGTKTVLERNPRDISVIMDSGSLAFNTQDYFSRLLEAERSPSKPVTPGLAGGK